MPGRTHPSETFPMGLAYWDPQYRANLNRMASILSGLQNMDVIGMPFERSETHFRIGPPPRPRPQARMYAEITGHDASEPWKHAAKEVRATDAVGFLLWEDLPNGITWDVVNKPLESIRFWVEAMAVGSIVEVYTLPLTNGPDASVTWFFDDRMEHLTEFQAEITARSGSDYSWKEKDFDASGVQRDRPDGRTGLFSNSFTKAVEVNGDALVPIGTVVNMKGTLLSNQNTRFWFIFDNLAPVMRNRVEFSTPGANSWVVPAGVTWMLGTAVGAGGGGSGGDDDAAFLVLTDETLRVARPGHGGGGGGTCMALRRVTPGQTITATVGAGGAGGAAGKADGAPGVDSVLTGFPVVADFPGNQQIFLGRGGFGAKGTASGGEFDSPGAGGAASFGTSPAQSFRGTGGQRGTAEPDTINVSGSAGDSLGGSGGDTTVGHGGLMTDGATGDLPTVGGGGAGGSGTTSGGNAGQAGADGFIQILYP